MKGKIFIWFVVLFLLGGCSFHRVDFPRPEATDIDREKLIFDAVKNKFLAEKKLIIEKGIVGQTLLLEEGEDIISTKSDDDFVSLGDKIIKLSSILNEIQTKRGKDERDIFEEMVGEVSFILPKKYYSGLENTVVLNQGSSLFCIGFSGAGAVKVWEKRLGGSYGYENFESLAENILQPNSRRYYNLFDNLESLEITNSKAYFIKRSVPSIKEVRASLIISGGVFTVMRNYKTRNFTEILHDPSWTKEMAGHIVFITDFDEKGFYFLNSWDKDWGDGGFGFISYENFNRCVFQVAVVMPKIPPKVRLSQS